MSYGVEIIPLLINKASFFIGKRVQKIESQDKFVTLTFSNGKSLLISWDTSSYGIAVIDDKEKKELFSEIATTPPISTSLKSQLVGTELVDINQINNDRIIRLIFRKTIGLGFFKNITIIFEPMERLSNLLMVDENNIITETAKHIYPERNSHRTILPGVSYKLPPEIAGISIEKWIDAPSKETLKSIVGIGNFLAKTLSYVELETSIKVIESLKDIRNFDNYKLVRIQNYITILPNDISLKSEEILSLENIGYYLTASSIYQNKLNSHKKNIKKHLRKEIIRREKQLGDIENLITTTDATLYKKYGDAIIYNLWNIKQGESECNLSYFSEQGEKLSVSVPIIPSLTFSQNAKFYFKKYKKILQSQSNAQILVKKVQGELNDLIEEEVLLDCCDEIKAIDYIADELHLPRRINQTKKQQLKEPFFPHKRIILEDSIIFIGLSAKGNHYVTFKLAAPDDIWFHAQGIPGTHVILRMTTTVTSERMTILFDLCSSIAVNYSKAKNENRIRVDHTQKKFISPIKISAQL